MKKIAQLKLPVTSTVAHNFSLITHHSHRMRAARRQTGTPHDNWSSSLESSKLCYLVESGKNAVNLQGCCLQRLMLWLRVLVKCLKKSTRLTFISTRPGNVSTPPRRDMSTGSWPHLWGPDVIPIYDSLVLHVSVVSHWTDKLIPFKKYHPRSTGV